MIFVDRDLGAPQPPRAIVYLRDGALLVQNAPRTFLNHRRTQFKPPTPDAISFPPVDTSFTLEPFREKR